MRLTTTTHDALDRVDRIRTATSVDDVVDLLSSALETFGFSAFLVTGLPSVQENLDDHVLFNAWPRDWYHLYLREGFYKHDPMAAYSRQTIAPFRWRDVAYPRDDLQAQRVMNRAADFGLRDGFSVPIYGARGEQACVTMAGEDLDLAGQNGPAVHLLALYAHATLRDLIRPIRRDRRHLSERERDVLQWAAEGKTNWEIGAILGISARTVHGHVQSASQKLDALNRTAAVVKALRLGEIAL